MPDAAPPDQSEPPLPKPAQPKKVSLRSWDVDPEKVYDSLLGLGKFSNLPVPERPADAKNA